MQSSQPASSDDLRCDLPLRACKAQTFALTVFGIEELDAGLADRGFHLDHGFAARVALGALEALDGVERDAGLLSQLRLRPAEKGARGFGLAWADHGLDGRGSAKLAI